MIDAKMSREDYDHLTDWNYSRLKLLAKSPKHFAHAIQYGSPDSDARKLGRVAHLAVLEPENFDAQIAVWTKKTEAGAAAPRRGKEWEAFKAANAGKELITEDERSHAMAISTALHEDPHAAPLLSGGQAEVSMSWEFSGLRLKCRLDLLTPTHVVELKTTRNADPRSFSWDAESYGYHAQAAWQLDGLLLTTGEQRQHVIVAVEDAAPHVAQVYYYGDAEIAEGRAEYQRWLAILEECQRSKSWRGYADGPMPLGLPRRARTLEHEGEAA